MIRKTFLWLSAVLLAAYVASFAFLACRGGYTFVPSGSYRPMTLASPDTFVWQPLHGTFYRFHDASDHDLYRADTLGYLYSPLILVAQRIRPSVTVFDPDGSSHPFPPMSQWHPSFREAVESLDRKTRTGVSGDKTIQPDAN
jgi:hypothetical protein